MIIVRNEDGERILIGWQQKWLTLLYCDHDEIDPLIIANHYSHTTSKNRFLSLGVFYEDTLCGGVQFGKGIRPKSKQAWGIQVTPDNAIEFDRLWLSDVCPRFSETVVISMTHKIIRKSYPHIRFILSYADGFQGYTGTIYKAAGYTEIAPINAEFFMTPDGKRYHPISMYHRYKSRATAVVQRHLPGAILMRGKHRRFIYQLW